ncbi:MAG: glutamine synthetase, partial [Spirochaetales bacterium]|nr:glutamine synthetase [Spirochaetales bacterium]
QPPEPLNENAFGMSEAQRAELGIGELPRSLHEAILLTEQSDLVRGALGDHIFDSFIRNKRIEWNAFRAHVTDFEIDRYLQTL